MITREEFYNALCERHGKEIQEKITGAVVGVAGLGGLGSNISVALTRLGVGRLVLVDFDKVDISNINRQHYFLRHIGTEKTKALSEQLLEINPWIELSAHTVRVTPENVKDLFGECDVICEAFDKPDQKAMLTETVMSELPDKPFVCAAGMAGYGSANEIKTVQRFKNVYICGDGHTGIESGAGLMAPRVAVCAAHQANMILRLILNIKQQ